MAVLYNRPEGESPSGLRQEAKDSYTRVGNQICLGPTSAYMGLGLEEAGWLKGREEGIGAVTFCLKVNDLPPVLGAFCLEPSPYQAPLQPAGHQEGQ